MTTELTIEQQRLLQQIQLHPGCTTTFVQYAINKSNAMANYELQKLMKAGHIYRVKSTSANNRVEYKYYVGKPSQQQECAKQKLAAQKEDEEKMKECSKKNIDYFTAREMMQALTKKGFSGRLSTTVQKEIKFEDLTQTDFDKLKSEGFTGIVKVSRLYEFALNGAEQPANNEI